MPILADSLTPGGVLVVIGSGGAGYNAIFDKVTRLATRGNQALPLSLNNQLLRAHADDQVRDIVEDAILGCLRYLETVTPRQRNARS